MCVRVCVFVAEQMWVEQRLVEAGQLSAHMRHGSPPTDNKRSCPPAQKGKTDRLGTRIQSVTHRISVGRVCAPPPTWPVREVAAAEAGDLHPLEEEHGGSDVRVHDMRPRLGRKWSVLRVQTETLACVSEKKERVYTKQKHTQRDTRSFIRWLTCCSRQLSAAPGLAFADWLDGDRVGSDPGVVNL